jgi:predicted ester cyclase
VSRSADSPPPGLARALETASLPRALRDYLEGLASHDVARVADTLAEELWFISATRILGKSQFLEMLAALYAGFPDWEYQCEGIEDRTEGNYAIRWRQGGRHTGVWAMPGMDPIAATGRRVAIPLHYFYYRVSNDRIVLIFPEPLAGGAPRGILQQLGAKHPPL